MKFEGEQFLHQKDSKLHTTDPVEHGKAEKERKSEKTSQKPVEKLADWMNVIERTHISHRDDPRVLERIKEHYYKEHVIKSEDVPESYFKNQRRLAREQGYGDIEVTLEMRDQLSEVIISDQKSTLDNWVNYFTSPDSDNYPMWTKYWAFTSMLKLSSYDKEKHAFGKRSKDTVAPFPDLNREALAYVVDIIFKKINKKHIADTKDNPELQKLLQGANFGKLYAYAIEKITPTEESELMNTQGEWVKYDQNSDYMPLVESLQGHGTGWCTTGETTAESQLQNGDFYTYYSYDKEGKPTIPRVAIRMQGSNIAEVRGVAHEQNLDPYIGDVVDRKLKEFPDGQAYQKKTANMRTLTEIDKKYKAEKELTKDNLRFLYEFDSEIEGFGYKEDPRIKEILASRDIKHDISYIIGCSPEQISTTKEESLKGGIIFHYGDLYLGNLQSAEGLKLPKSIGGSLSLDSLQSAKGLKIPENIGGDLLLNNLQFAEELELPKSIGGFINLMSLQSAKGLKFPENIGGNINLGRLQFAEDLNFPETINGFLDLNSLLSAKGLKLPKSIGGNLVLDSLQSAEGLKFPESIGGSLILDSLQSAEGLEFPENINGSLSLDSLQSAKGLKLPKSIGDNLYLDSLQSAKGLKLPKSIGGDINLGSLQSAEKTNLKKQYPNLKII